MAAQIRFDLIFDTISLPSEWEHQSHLWTTKYTREANSQVIFNKLSEISLKTNIHRRAQEEHGGRGLFTLVSEVIY